MTTRRGFGLLMLTLVLTAALLTWRAMTPGPANAADPEPPAAVPVTTAASRIQDMPLYLNGLGTVQPPNVVEIKAQVSGTLIALPVPEGAEVQQGDIVAEIDPRPYKAALDQALAQRDEDIALLKSAQLDLKRYQNLAKTNFAPVQQVEDQQGTVDKQIGAIGVDNAMIETARINLGYCVIKAPFAGRVSFYQLNVGNLVQAASQTGIISITQVKPIQVVFTLPEADLAPAQQAREHGPVAVTVFDGSSNQQLATGTLTTLNNTIDPASGTIALKATFANQDGHLWPGQFVNTRVQVGLLRHAVTVPSLAIQHGPNGTFVYTVKPDGTVAQTSVQVGDQVAQRIVVTTGLSGQQTVVVSGQSRLAPGVHVHATDVSNASPGEASPT
ncbi:efflux RND transporter periplasmic adaptor subunit [Rhodopila sp.]|uniref:efflux RND transporter periplasmic adaptor subunit n=1 Tax=Rhodopila sp. TaxID=2480087 RepID=UPI003D0BF301